MSDAVAAPGRPASAMSHAELVAITAATMALNALAIDIMLPALGVIGDELRVVNANDRQLVVGVYLLGNGIAQLFFGPIVDRFGRRRVVMWALGGYVAASFLSAMASGFVLFLMMRAAQGAATAAARVAIIASVRDQVSGRRMAEVMSLAVTFFMAAPIIAPGVGQAILAIGPWRAIFVALGAYGAALALWAGLRLPETLPEGGGRRALNVRAVIADYTEFLRNRVSLGYTLLQAFCFGGLFGYISASEQVLLETYDVGVYFPIAFAVVAIALGAATISNAKLVGRFGMRLITHVAVVLYLSVGLVHVALQSVIDVDLYLFLSLMSAAFFALGLIGPNATALALEPMGRIAGAAASVNGFLGTTVSAILGVFIARGYDGTPAPLVVGMTLMGAAALTIALVTERGRLFQPAPERR